MEVLDAVFTSNSKGEPIGKINHTGLRCMKFLRIGGCLQKVNFKVGVITP